MTDIELKPCPFCGGKATLYTKTPYASYVKCQICGAKTDLVKISTECSSDERAIEVWNRSYVVFRNRRTDNDRIHK